MFFIILWIIYSCFFSKHLKILSLILYKCGGGVCVSRINFIEFCNKWLIKTHRDNVIVTWTKNLKRKQPVLSVKVRLFLLFSFSVDVARRILIHTPAKGHCLRASTPLSRSIRPKTSVSPPGRGISHVSTATTHRAVGFPPALRAFCRADGEISWSEFVAV